ncbi:MAG: type II toxin-antitoxin system RelE/ParE family toxin [Candidatus Neomarinimicrobiota bacterium]
MASYRIKIERRAFKALATIARRFRTRIRKAIEGLSEEPWPPGVRKLTDEERLYRIRLGDYRVVYQIQDEDLLVLIVKIGHRKEIYR